MWRISKIVFFIMVVLVTNSNVSFANEGAVESSSAVDFSKQAYESLFASSGETKTELENSFDKKFGFSTFADACLSDLNGKMSANEKAELVAKFKTFFFLSLSQKSNVLYERRIVKPIFDLKESAEASTLVEITGQTAAGDDSKFQFYLEKTASQWQVVDFTVSKALASRNYKGSFNRVFREKGFQGLMQRLDDKIQALKSEKK